MADTSTGAATLVVGSFLTLDCVMQAPGGPDEDREGGFDHGGWTVPYWDDRMGEVMDEQFDAADALLLGRKTYEIFAGHWPLVDTTEDTVGSKLNEIPKFVASRTLETAEWTNSTILSGEAPGAVGRLKAERLDDVILVQGSQNLLQSLLGQELIDEFWLWVFPVVLGEGKRLFGPGTEPERLELTWAEPSTTGVQLLRYEPAGAVEYGSFALADEGGDPNLDGQDEEPDGR